MDKEFDFEAPADMELLGGTMDDEPKEEPIEADPIDPVDDEPKDPVDAPKEDDPKPEDPPKRDPVIPRARFDEVNAKLHAEREESARLKAELEALSKGKTAEPSQPASVDALEEAYFEALIDGNKAEAKVIRAKINAEIYAQAKAASEEAVTETLSQREIQSEFSRVVAQTVSDYPFLDSASQDANAEAIGEVVEWRDFYIGKGESPAVALQKAAAKIGPLYAKVDEAKTDPEPKVDPRKQAAATTAAKTANAQPPAAEAGVGNRAIPLGDDLLGDQSKWEKASETERLRYLS